MVPRPVQSCSQLHDCVDVNCYGGAESLLDELSEQAPDTDEGKSAAMSAMIDVMSPSIEFINEWLATGGKIRDSASRRER